jgi:hypothetical protein
MSEPKWNAEVKCVTRTVTKIAAAWLAVACIAVAQTAPPAARPHRTHKPPAARNVEATPAPLVQQTPPQPEMPKWPANDPPAQPSVTLNSQGLHIQATNSSLSQILNEVSTETGAKIEGLSGDERVFGEYGPGQPRDVLAQLLHGSGYDFLLLGSEEGPLKLILSSHHTGAHGPANQAYNRPMPDGQPDEDQSQEQDEEPPIAQPQPFQPQPPPGQENPQGAMTPQQRMQMMQQQRLQQMQQMQQQYQQNQQNQQQPQ